MLPELNDEEIRSYRTEKRNEAVDFFGLDQVPSYLDGVATPFGDR
jgi:hypothetical protein